MDFIINYVTDYMKNNDWLLTFKIVIFLLFLFVLYVIYMITQETIKTYPNLKTNKNEMRTGDLLFVKYDTIYANLIKVFTGTNWVHCAMVYKRYNEIYIVEVTSYSHDTNGLMVRTLNDWLNLNRYKTIAYCEYRGDITPNEKQIDKYLERCKGINWNRNVFYWLNTQIPRSYSYEMKDNYFCTEFIAKFLQDFNMIDKHYLPCSYGPTDLTKLKEYNSTLKIFQ